MRRLKAERDRYKKENERMQAASNTVDTPCCWTITAT